MIVSRSVTSSINNNAPTILENVLGKKQTSQTDYNYYTYFTVSQEEGADFSFDCYMIIHTVGTNSLRKYEIVLDAFTI